jgi:hypothetical protein
MGEHEHRRIVNTVSIVPVDHSDAALFPSGSTGVNGRPAAQVRLVTRVTTASSVPSASSAVDRLNGTLFRGAREYEAEAQRRSG